MNSVQKVNETLTLNCRHCFFPYSLFSCDFMLSPLFSLKLMHYQMRDLKEIGGSITVLYHCEVCLIIIKEGSNRSRLFSACMYILKEPTQLKIFIYCLNFKIQHVIQYSIPLYENFQLISIDVHIFSYYGVVIIMS